jgi:hypothetical protein
VLFLVCAVLPWFTFDFGFGISESINGFDFSLVTGSFVLLLLATVWALLPAVYPVAVPFPRSVVTVGLTGLAFLLTLLEWISTFEAGFSVFALLTFLAAAAALAFALLRLLPELRSTPSLPGSLGDAAQWANQQAPQFGGQGSAGGSQSYGPPDPYAQQPGPWPQPPAGPVQQHRATPPPPPAGGTGTGQPGGPPAPGSQPGPSADPA